MLKPFSLLYLLLSIWMLQACTPSAPRPEDALGTGRLFIRSLLDGNFTTANSLLYKDSTNLVNIKKFEEQYEERISQPDKIAYKKADIIIHEITPVNDSVVIIYYSSSLQKQKKPLRLLKKENLWEVDFYYSFTGNL
jgi:hypothetical protein